MKHTRPINLSFRLWCTDLLINHYDELINTPKGDFITDMMFDPEWPDKRYPTDYLDYLHESEASAAAVDAFKELWEDYEDDWHNQRSKARLRLLYCHSGSVMDVYVE